MQHKTEAESVCVARVRRGEDSDGVREDAVGGVAEGEVVRGVFLAGNDVGGYGREVEEGNLGGRR